ncbi:expressed unknown protein [Seminavis robusta]|uniref:Uncharacterized protein n=1 Tax=Seminavis robusta TaxID=568900 RepID=A0A9N8DC97_9STRA|nr:expressed unknown protein [Seminavis robusta]|eukprot:Sro86_g045570.1 n/a (152) ;mRNA; f:11006-11461
MKFGLFNKNKSTSMDQSSARMDASNDSSQLKLRRNMSKDSKDIHESKMKKRSASKKMRGKRGKSSPQIMGLMSEMNPDLVMDMMQEMTFVDGHKAGKYWDRMKRDETDHVAYVNADAAQEYWNRLKMGCTAEDDEDQEGAPIGEICFPNAA